MAGGQKGQQLAGRYVLLSRLAESRYAEAWHVKDSTTRGFLTLKLARAGEDFATARRLLANEHAVGSALHHPHLLRYHDWHDEPGLAFLTREYLDAGDLRAWRGRAAELVAPLVAQVCEALSEMHAAGYVHRDIKASNILLDGAGDVRLADFSVAGRIGDTDLIGGGSPHTASPEQRAGKPPAISDDLYSLGLLWSSLLAGAAPQDGRAPALPSGTPERDAGIIRSLLDPDPAARPTDLAALAAQLGTTADPNATAPPDAYVSREPSTSHVESVATVTEPVVPLQPGTSAPAPRVTPRMGVSNVTAAVVVASLIGIAVAAFYWLPRLAPQATVETESNAQAASSAALDNGVEPWRLAQMARERKEAERRLEQLVEKQFELEEKRVLMWAPGDFERAREAAIEGDRLFRSSDFTAALAEYSRGDDLLASLLAKSESLVPDSLEQASAALASGDGDRAAEAFALVLALEPKNADALAGRDRAANLSTVLAKVEAGRELEEAGKLTEALAAYRGAAALDGQWQAANEGAARVATRLAGQRFARAMSEGYAALEKGDSAAARAAFDRAAALRPNASALRDARAQVAALGRDNQLERLRSQASALEAAGEFIEAKAVYAQALELSPSARFAVDGVSRTNAQADLSDQLAALIARPDRLASDSVQGQAQRVIERVERRGGGNAVLQRQVAQLRELMAAGRQTLQVRLVSDNQTNVLVYRVGELGRFDATVLDLRPGTYTAIGSRDGYRDVRREFRVGPGVTPEQIEIRCVDRI